ncbi:MAG: hypothetical protein JWN48_3933 [Myxococcaceae bacterium]|nr:hypothetical protein [Myxococcaceae bacterium]
MIDTELSRRQLLVRSAATAAGFSLSLSLMAAQKAHAAVDPVPNPAADNTQLNALLKAEYDAIATYTAGAMLIAADTVADSVTKDTVTKVATHFLSQHQDHANALKALITANGGTPEAQSSTAKLPKQFTDLAKPTTTDVIKLAADKEKAAAYTYALVMQSISTTAAAKLVAAIGGVETQHFIVLYLLAEGLISATAATNSMATLVVPASFILDGVGVAGTSSLSNNPTLDAALAFDPKPA